MRALKLILMAAIAGTIQVASTATAQDASRGSLELNNPFFAFDNGVGRGKWSPEQQAAVLAELGYDGIGYTGTRNIPAMLKALRAHGLKMYSTYVRLDLNQRGGSFEPGLPEAIRQLKGEGTLIWLHVHGGKPSSDALDEQAVRAVRQMAALADASGLRLAFYPHVGTYVATVQDAVRLARKVDRPNVGASFNLCHFLKLEDESLLPKQLREARPYLFVVSINGADSGNTRQMGWDRLIQTLDRGTFDVFGALKTLKQLGYDGPVGLQCYKIPGDVRRNLQRSMRAWRQFAARMGS